MFRENNNSLREIVTGMAFLALFVGFIISAGLHL